MTRYHARICDGNLAAINHDPAELIATQNLPPLFSLWELDFYSLSRGGFSVERRGMTVAARMFDIDLLEAIDYYEEAIFSVAAAVERAFARLGGRKRGGG